MTLKEKISADYLSAFKSKDSIAKNILSVVKGEIQTVEKNTGALDLADSEVIKILTKTAKSLKETIALANDEKSKQELSVIENYLPKQMSREEVVVKVTELISSGVTQIGSIMKEFSTLPADKKIVSEVVKEILK
jgi:uncharacterized protein YqeY